MIRHAKRSEIEKIITITRACGEKMASEGIFQWNKYYPNTEAFNKDIDRNELFVLTLSEEIIGCIVISSTKDIEYDAIDWLTEDTKHYYIHRLAISPAHQKKGYAKKLMDFAENYAITNRAASIRLDTFSKNLGNQMFYETRGYKRLGNIYFPKQSEHPFYCYELVLIG
jgi:ribosomal protein S18 acetylase RimI-like enzyme